MYVSLCFGVNPCNHANQLQTDVIRLPILAHFWFCSIIFTYNSYTIPDILLPVFTNALCDCSYLYTSVATDEGSCSAVRVERVHAVVYAHYIHNCI